MDLRFEMATSEELSEDEGGRRSFINNQYRDGNTNKGFCWAMRLAETPEHLKGVPVIG